jgi:branched-subunit amino acid transport protein
VNAWLIILAAGLGSFLFRVSLVSLADRITMPARLERATGFIPPATFAALATTSVAEGCLDVAVIEAVPPLAAVAVAVAAVARTGSTHAALLTGMPTLWVGTALLSL